jgi:hypothetical protein
MTQVVSWRSLTAVTRVRARIVHVRFMADIVAMILALFQAPRSLAFY